MSKINHLLQCDFFTNDKIIFPIYGFHLKIGKVILQDLYQLIRFVKSIKIIDYSYCYLGAVIGEYYHELWQYKYSYQQLDCYGNINSNMNAEKEFYWIFIDGNGQRFDMKDIFNKYKLLIRFSLSHQKKTLAYGETVPHTGKRKSRNKFGTPRNNIFIKNDLENIKTKEYLEDYPARFFNNMKKHINSKKTNDKWVRYVRDGENNNWKQYRKKQYK